MSRPTRLLIATTVSTLLVIWELYSPFTPNEINQILREDTGVRIISVISWFGFTAAILRMIQIADPR